MFIQQKARSQQLLNSLQQKPLVPSYLFSALQVELANLNNIYTSYEPLISTATQLLEREPSFNSIPPFSKCTRRSLLCFLGDDLSWLTGTALTRDVKERVNQLIETQTQQQEALVHAISILNVTRYAMQVNRQCTNAVMEAVVRTNNDVTTLFNIMSSIYTCINYQQILLHVHSILANLRDSFYYMRQIAMHVMNYMDTTTTSILSPHVFPVEDLQEMLIHIKAELPSTKHSSVSLDDTLHFNRNLCTHILIVEEHFLLLIDVPIQDCAQQLEIYQVFNLLIPKGNLSAYFDIDTKYLGISYDEMKEIEISEQQFTTCQQANRQFCNIRVATHQGKIRKKTKFSPGQEIVREFYHNSFFRLWLHHMVRYLPGLW